MIRMNKQQLAATIWESAQNLRGKIEANDYKDYILGFIFYKYLSDKQLEYLLGEGMTIEDIANLTSDNEYVKEIKSSLGYFIESKNLFKTWLESDNDFTVDNVIQALKAFSRSIDENYKKVFSGIFKTLENGIINLGDTSVSRTKAIRNLINIIKDVPTANNRDYDVLGFIYEYLISQFASNAGKKAGEFYTPNEVSIVMAEIVAHHLQDKKHIEIYDPTSGSGSLLITIGQSFKRYNENKNAIKYYAQELKENTFNLTRMNLTMRGIIPDNIIVRNGDTLEEDWPYFDNNPEDGYELRRADAVVSNPPYSQQWDPSEEADTDPRYAEYGVAPSSKADFAFLLHDLYHLKTDGIMAIVLPHGVLFRGGEEGEIRKNLLEKNNIEAVIGLPANIFFGTSIPTCIIILKKEKINDNTDILFIDASKEFIKVGKKNELSASNIRKIVDTVVERKDVPKYSRVVSLEEVKENGYNLNIPRYVDSAEPLETWDIYATMYGGIPKSELEQFAHIWEVFPNLYNVLFEEINSNYVELKNKAGINNLMQNAEIVAYDEKFKGLFSDFDTCLQERWIRGLSSIKITRELNTLTEELFSRLEKIELLDHYKAYQILDDHWEGANNDIELLQYEGFDSAKIVDPIMIKKKVKGGEVEVQDGWQGRIFPFKLIQDVYFKKEQNALLKKENRLIEITSEIEEIITSLSEADGEYEVLNDKNDKFVTANLANKLNSFYKKIETGEIRVLNDYLDLLEQRATIVEKQDFIANYTEIHWEIMDASSNGTYSKASINERLKEIQKAQKFPTGSFEDKLAKAQGLLDEEKQLKAQIKDERAELEELAKEKVENLIIEEIEMLLKLKWIEPLIKEINQMPEEMLKEFEKKIKALAKKYETTLIDTTKSLEKSKKSLVEMMNGLTGNDFDMKGIRAFQAMLGGEFDE